MPARRTAAAAAADMLNRQGFEEVLGSLRAQVEKRRRRYLRFFYINSVLAFVLVAVALFCSDTVLASIAHAMGRITPISTPEILSFHFFALICAASLVLLPVLRYQGSLKPEFALHRRVWQRLCEAMGEVELMPRGAEFQHQLRASALFNAGAGIAERPGIKGRAGSYQFWVQEVAIVNNEGEAPFCGVAVFGRSDRRLHGDEDKRVYRASIADDDINLQAEAAHFRPFAQLVLHAPSRQKLYWDLRLLHYLQGLRDRAGEWFANRHTKPALAAELDYEAQFLAPADMQQAFYDACESLQFPDIQLSLQANNYVAVLRCASPLFINFSLFEPAFPAEKAMFVLALVQAIEKIAGESRS